MLQRNPSQKEPSGSWSEDKDQCQNLQGSEEDSSKQEEVNVMNQFLNEGRRTSLVTL